MLQKRLLSGFDKRGLRKLLLLIFLALGVPTVVLIWQAYSQLKWEAFHQHRGAAEELTERVNARLNALIISVDAQKFGDYAFLVVSGDPSANFVQRSPLSAYPVESDVPGVMGYFQVDTDGIFSTPLLPLAGSQAASLGIDEVEYESRLNSALTMQSILLDNRLLQSRQVVGFEGRFSGFARNTLSPVVREAATNDVGSNAAQFELDEEEPTESDSAATSVYSFQSELASSVPATSPAVPADASYRQEVFDDLNRPRRQDSSSVDKSVVAELAPEMLDAISTDNESAGSKLRDIKLKVDLQKKSELVERKEALEEVLGAAAEGVTVRSKRRENTALPESVRGSGKDRLANVAGPADIRISTFESEIDPFEFSLLDSGHFVLFRKVWRDGARYTQGILIDREVFIQDILGARFRETSLSNMSDLIVAYQDDVISRFGGRARTSASNVAADLGGELLYRSRLVAPFGKLESVYSLKRLPAGPGASVLAWVTLILAVVFVAGFLTLYRLGSSQIDLARQQQDFVSAVSHELKSPLTSIRMYGEMLREGWADEEKRQTYYEFIHDESERLSRLISNVLQLASITRNEPQFDMKAVAVTELMSNIESKIASQIARSGFTLKINKAMDADGATVDIDEDCFVQIIINLVDNAIKFSKDADNKTIEISSQVASNGDCVFTVRDFGPGIAKDQMKKIFQLFYRSESELTRETVGTGIGLAIVHQLTAAMNGRVDLLNASPGARFELRFPATKR